MRNPKIDQAKGLAIFLVVMGHVLNFCFYGDNASNSFCYKIIYSFHMPLFMFLSGMVVKDNCLNLKSIGLDLNKRFRTLVVPMLVVGLIYAYSFGYTIIEFFKEYNKLGYWYLIALCSLYVLFRLLSLVIHKSLKIINLTREILVWVVCYLLFVCAIRIFPGKISNVFCLGQACRFFPYFIMGYLFSKYKMDSILKSDKIYALSLFIYVLAFALEYKTNCVHCWIPVFEIIQATAAIIWVMSLIWGHGNKNPITQRFELWGGKSLDIYVFHYFFYSVSLFPCLTNYFQSNKNLVQELLVGVFFSIVIVYLSLTVAGIIHHSQLLNKFIFGKVKK